MLRGEGIMRDVIEGAMEGGMTVGRLRNGMLHDLREITGDEKKRQYIIAKRMEKLEGKRLPRQAVIDSLKKVADEELKRKIVIPFGELKRIAEDREAWKSWMPCTCRMAEH